MLLDVWIRRITLILPPLFFPLLLVQCASFSPAKICCHCGCCFLLIAASPSPSWLSNLLNVCLVPCHLCCQKMIVICKSAGWSCVEMSHTQHLQRGLAVILQHYPLPAQFRLRWWAGWIIRIKGGDIIWCPPHQPSSGLSWQSSGILSRFMNCCTWEIWDRFLN